MKDRIPTKKNRVKLIFPDKTEYATMERADEPLQTETPLNKANILTEQTAQSLGFDALSDPSVNDAFAKVGDMLEYTYVCSGVEDDKKISQLVNSFLTQESGNNNYKGIYLRIVGELGFSNRPYGISAPSVYCYLLFTAITPNVTRKITIDFAAATVNLINPTKSGDKSSVYELMNVNRNGITIINLNANFVFNMDFSGSAVGVRCSSNSTLINCNVRVETVPPKSGAVSTPYAFRGTGTYINCKAISVNSCNSITGDSINTEAYGFYGKMVCLCCMSYALVKAETGNKTYGYYCQDDGCYISGCYANYGIKNGYNGSNPTHYGIYVLDDLTVYVSGNIISRSMTYPVHYTIPEGREKSFVRNNIYMSSSEYIT